MYTLSNINPNKANALMIAKRQLPEFVYDAVQLEGKNFSFPEIQTLLERITIGGHKLSEQQIAINQADEKEMNRFLRTCLDPKIIDIMEE